MINIQAKVFVCNTLTTFQINEAFWKVTMQNDVIGCVIFIWNQIQYLEK